MSPPLTPDADEARRQLAEELSKPIYADVQNWISDQFRKLLDWLTGDQQASGTLSSGQLAAIGIAVAALALVAVWALMGPVRAERRRRQGDVLTGEDRTAEQLRADASALAASDAWGDATLQLFRALVRSLSERAVIEETPGMTAHEAAGRAAVRLPGLADGLSWGADTFDALAYGRRPGARDQYERMRDLDELVTRARPELPEDTPEAPSAVEVEVA